MRQRVLLLEAGGMDNWIWFHIPVGYLFAIGNPRSDWMFKTEPEEGLNGRSLNYPRGKAIGGSSAINAMIYMRGQAADYDHWRQLGLAGWGWDDVLPFFKRHEDHVLGPSEAHAVGGELRIEAPRVRWDILDAFRDAANEAGVAPIPDFNTGDNEGSCVFRVNQKRGRRWSAARGFLKPVLGRPNLRLETQCLVEGLVFDGKRAVGVRWRQNGATRSARCRGEVVLAAGAIGSIQLLKLSGSAPPASSSVWAFRSCSTGRAWARTCRIICSFGSSTRSRASRRSTRSIARVWSRARMGLDYALFRRGPLTMAPSQLGLFTLRSVARARQHPVPRAAAVARQVRRPAARVPRLHGERVQSAADEPRLRAVALTDPADKPMIKPNYLSTDEDRRVAADSIRVARGIVAQPALAKYKPAEYLPGSSVGNDDAALIKAAGDVGTTIFHPVGTAKMGRATDRRWSTSACG